MTGASASTNAAARTFEGSIKPFTISASSTSPVEGDTITWTMIVDFPTGDQPVPGEGRVEMSETDTNGNPVQVAVTSSKGAKTVDQTFNTAGDYYFDAQYTFGAIVGRGDEDLNGSPVQVSVTATTTVTADSDDYTMDTVLAFGDGFVGRGSSTFGTADEGDVTADRG
jgi:hypothetical protein